MTVFCEPARDVPVVESMDILMTGVAAALGEAAGKAAAVAVRRGVAPREVSFAEIAP